MPYSQVFMRTYQYVMEVLFLYIALFLLYIHTEIIPPFFPFLLICGIGGVSFAYILSLMKSNTPYFLIMLFVPVVAYISSMFGLSFGVSLFLAGVVCWRIVSHYRRDTKITESSILNVSLGGGFLIYLGAAVQGYPHRELILYLIMALLLFFMISKILTSLYTSSIANQDHLAKKQSGSVIALFGLMVAGAVGLAVVLPFLLKKVLTLLLTVSGYGLYAVSGSLFGAVEKVKQMDPEARGDEAPPMGWDQALEDLNPITDMVNFLTGVNFWAIVGILCIILLAILLFFLGKRKFILPPSEEEEDRHFNMATNSVEGTVKKARRKKRKTPQEKIRKLVFELEMLATTKSKGRLHFETVAEWLQREKFLEPSLVSYYERVRYGEQQLSEKENEICEEIAKKLKMQLRAIKVKK
ncbi:cation:proton antiporter [Bacillus timonensis]|nr:cation:proton antiporter [Bacillus timonensis]